MYGSKEKKYAAIVAEIQECLEKDRAVLVGTRTVSASEALSVLLQEKNIEHSLLNARYLDREADIVERAGQPGCVTVATNMAGRGTDIKLDPLVRESGGLHVILTELHESPRIDWQLIGRGSRQGDPGTFRIYVSFDDEVLKLGLGDAKAERLRLKHADADQLHGKKYLAHFTASQMKVEKRHMTDRLIMSRGEEQRQKNLQEGGIDPFLNSLDD